jgi:hypothetical protein
MASVGAYFRRLFGKKKDTYLSENFGELVDLSNGTEEPMLRYWLGSILNRIWELKNSYKIDLTLDSLADDCSFGSVENTALSEFKDDLKQLKQDYLKTFTQAETVFQLLIDKSEYLILLGQDSDSWKADIRAAEQRAAEQIKAAIKIQSTYREKRDAINARYSARLLIQAFGRGYIARQSYSKLKRAALLVQNLSRGFLARISYVANRKSAIKIQSKYRGHRGASAYAIKKAKILPIQKVARGRLARRSYVANRESVIKFQSQYRRHRDASAYARKQANILPIQKIVRGFLARRSYYKMKERDDLKNFLAGLGLGELGSPENKIYVRNCQNLNSVINAILDNSSPNDHSLAESLNGSKIKLQNLLPEGINLNNVFRRIYNNVGLLHENLNEIRGIILKFNDIYLDASCLNVQLKKQAFQYLLNILSSPKIKSKSSLGYLNKVMNSFLKLKDLEKSSNLNASSLRQSFYVKYLETLDDKIASDTATSAGNQTQRNFHDSLKSKMGSDQYSSFKISLEQGRKRDRLTRRLRYVLPTISCLVGEIKDDRTDIRNEYSQGTGGSGSNTPWWWYNRRGFVKEGLTKKLSEGFLSSVSSNSN